MKKNLLTLCFIAVAFNLTAQKICEVTTYTGRPVKGYKDGPKDSAEFNLPYGIVKDASGNIYVGELENSCIRKIDINGIVSTYAGTAKQKTFKDGFRTNATFSQPSRMCFDKNGDMIVVDNLNNRIRKIAKDGTVTTIAGNGIMTSTDGNALNASFHRPRSIFMDDSSNFFILDQYAVRKLSPNGQVTTLVKDQSYSSPQGILGDKSGNLIFSETNANKLWKIGSNGTLTQFATVNRPGGLCFGDSGYIYVAGGSAIYKISPDGSNVEILAGKASESGNTDGVGASARFSGAIDIVMIAPDEFLVCQQNGLIRKLKIKTPAPPKTDYKNLPGSVCLGSTVSYEPSVTGSIPELTLKANVSDVSAAKFYHRHKDDIYIVNANDSILQYDKQGTLKKVWNDLPYLTDVRSLEVDDQGRLYIVAIDNNTTYTVVYRFNADGTWDISWQTPMNYYWAITDMAFGSDGYLYVLDSGNVDLTKIDVSASTPAPSKLYNSNSQYSMYRPAGISFDKTGTMYIADVGHNNILRRDPANGNFYKVFQGFDSLNWRISNIDIDTAAGDFVVYASSGGKAPYKTIQISGLENTQIMDYGTFVPDLDKPAAIFEVNETGKAPVYWALNSGKNELVKHEIYAFTITPQLPAGLRYNMNTGEISGTPTVAAPLKSYIIKVTNNYGTNYDTIVFGVTPPGPLSSNNGVSNSPLVNHKDGFTIQYYKENDCEKMISLSDDAGGSTPGNVLVSQTISPIAMFSSKAFVGRVTEIKNSNPQAEARLKLYFTYQDIVNYNANNGAAQDLSNDTTGGTMDVAVLQMHTDTTGREVVIKHYPTAMWISKDKNWQVDFKIDKFSTFYMGDPLTIDDFDCATSGSDSIAVQGDSYEWWGTKLTASGTYYYTLPNDKGCDSFATLKLTLIPDTTGTGSLVVYSNTSVNVFPNPGTGIFDLEIKNLLNTDYTISVVNMLGEEVYTSISNGMSKLDLQQVPDGVYFIRISGGNIHAIKRIVKQQ